MPRVSVIMPVYNVEAFVGFAVKSVLTQTYEDFELIIVDDVSPDNSMDICEAFQDDRIRIVRHDVNRGLAGARNTGIFHAQGDYIAFLDSDDMWRPEKLMKHVRHLDCNPSVGVSFSQSEFMSPEGEPIDYFQMPQLENITPGHLLRRNPIGNGSAPVIRRETLDEIRFNTAINGDIRTCWFDERFRQSEDIECWVRICVNTQWTFEGIPSALTLYRLNAEGLSANLHKQLASWEQMIAKIKGYAPALLKGNEKQARAYQLRYMARQAIRMKDGKSAVVFANKALFTSFSILFQEPGRTIASTAAAYLMWLLPRLVYQGIESIAQHAIGRYQERSIKRRQKKDLYDAVKMFTGHLPH